MPQFHFDLVAEFLQSSRSDHQNSQFYNKFVDWKIVDLQTES